MVVQFADPEVHAYRKQNGQYDIENCVEYEKLTCNQKLLFIRISYKQSAICGVLYIFVTSIRAILEAKYNYHSRLQNYYGTGHCPDQVKTTNNLINFTG